MLSLSYLFEFISQVMPDDIVNTPSPVTDAAAKMFNSKLRDYHDRQTWGGKLFHKLNPPNVEQDNAFEAAKKAVRKRDMDSLPKDNWYKK